MTNRFVLPLLGLILLLAAGLRWYNLNWDDGTFAHPDERSTVAFYAPTITWPKDTATIFDPRQSTLNPFLDINNPTQPRSYTYGHFPLYVLVLTAHALNYLAPLTAGILPADWTAFLADSLSGRGFAVIGRGLVGLSDVVSVYLLFLLGRRIYGAWGGLLAAALSAVTVLQIQLAHFFAVDPVSTTFTLLALYGALLMYEQQSAKNALICGVGIGLAVASKFSALPIAAAPVIASLLVFIQPPAQPDLQDSEHLTSQNSSPSLNTMISLTMLALLTSFVVFAMTSPFVLLDYDNFHRAVVEEQGRMVSGEADFPFTRQFRNTTAYVYFIDQQIRWGMGWPLGLVAMAGTLWVIVRAFRRQAHVGELLALSWVILYFGPTGLFLAKFIRYMVPIVPIFTLFGAGLVVWLWQLGEREKTKHANDTKDVNDPPDKTSHEQEGQIANQLTDEQANEPINETSHEQEGQISNQPKNEESPLRDPSSSFDISRSPFRLLSLALGSFTLIGSLIWALAFVNGVYGTPHTWVTFANWTYANVPDGSCIAWEHWDDRMPADLPYPGGNPGAHGYRQPQLPMYEEDNQQKYELLRTTLMDCDYIALATNRLYLTIPKLPQRYPMSMRYYEALFSGELGFEQVYSAETPPRLGPLVIDDQSADESFTVYDHPKPIMFKKVRQLTLEEWDNVLKNDPNGGNRWDKAVPGYTGGPTLMMRLRGSGTPPEPTADPAKTGKSLLLDRPIAELPIVNDFRWNTAANHSTPLAIVIWWLALAVIGWLNFPLTFALCHRLPDRGYALSRSLGLLVVCYFVWFNSSWGLLENRLSTIIVGLIVLLAINAWFIHRYRADLLTFIATQRETIISAEIVFMAVYAFFLYLRLRNPDLWQPWLGGEKMLEIGFLNAIVKSAIMPPYDPFFAGGIINYYYYGLFIVSTLIKLTGIEPTIAFNLAIPSLAALTAINVFSLARNLSPITSKPSASLLPGLLAILLVIFMGNIEGGLQFSRNLSQVAKTDFETSVPGVTTVVRTLDGLRQVWNGATLNTYNYWDPTRVIPATINEFPYFSFLFADLHPHMIGIPFTVLLLSLAYNLLIASQSVSQSASQPISELATEPLDGVTNEAVDEQMSEEANESISETIDEPMGEVVNEPINKDSPIRNFADSLMSQLAPSQLRFLALPFVLGALAVINTWDVPTYLGVMLTAFMLNQYRRPQGQLNVRLFVTGGAFALITLVIMYLMYWPFFAHYQAMDVGLGLVHTQTPLDAHLKIWGFFIFLIASWWGISLINPNTRHSFLRLISLTLRHWNVVPRLYELHQRLVRPTSLVYEMGWPSISFTFLAMAILYGFGYLVPAYLLPLVLISIILLFRRELSPQMAYIGALLFTGLLLLLGVEAFFLRDFLGGGDYYRMNTLFKFFTQVWVIFGIATALILPRLWDKIGYWPLWAQIPWRLACLGLLMACLVYPPLATRTRMDDRFPGERPPIGSLDGLAYMTVGQFEWPAGSPIQLKYDYEAIHWLQENVPGTPIIAEAKVGYYREGGMRVAAYTGLPSILGGLHQGEQRYASQVGERDMPVNEFWSTPDPNRTWQLLQQLNIDYVYIGQVERVTHGAQVEDKFRLLVQQGSLEVVFENEQTRIYKRKG